MADKAKKWILLAEDDADLKEALVANLELKLGSDLKIIPTSDGIEASGKITYQAFDCIITDLKMPKKEGQALIKSVSQSPLNNKCPIVVISGEPDYRLEKQYDNLRIFEKPFDTDDLILHIETQVKLGPTDQRLTASVINNFIKGIQEFIKTTWKVTVDIDTPFIKEASQPLNGDVFRRYHVRCGKKSSSFIVGFETSFLDEMSKKANVPDASHDRVSMALGDMVKKRVFQGAAQDTDFTDKGFANSKDDSNLEREAKMRGIVIPLAANDKKIFMQIFW